MKTLKLFLSISMVFLLFGGFTQTTIWSEDFESYADNSGYIGSGSGAVTTGDYPALVTKWTLDASGGDLSEDTDWFMVNEFLSNNLFEARDIDGPCIWLSESIDILGYVDVSFELLFSETGNHETADYIDVEYKTGTGSWTKIINWNNEGDQDHTLIDDFLSQTPTIIGLVGSSLQIRVTMRNDRGAEFYRFDDVLVEGTISQPPDAEFSADNLTPTTIESVSFTDLSTVDPSSWAWVFTPSTVTFINGDANSQHPQVRFDVAGLYTVSLKATNALGDDTEIKTDYIDVTEQSFPLTNPGTYYFTVPDNVYTIQTQVYGGGGGGAGKHTPNGGDDGGGGGGGAGYCGGTLTVNPGDLLTIAVGAGGNGGVDDQYGENGGNSSVTHNISNESTTANGGNGGESSNNGGAGGSGSNGDYTGAVFNPVSFNGGTGANGTQSNGGGAGGGAGDSNAGSSGSGTNGGTGGNANGGDGGNGSTNNALGENGSTFGGGGGGASDNGPSVGGNGADGAVSIFWTAITSPPVAEFNANNLTPTTLETVSFTDESTFWPTNWSWTFTPSTVTYIGGSSTSQNPQVQFDVDGLYTVSLVSTNTIGSDTETKIEYISVTEVAAIWTESFTYDDGTVVGQGNPAIASWTADGIAGGKGVDVQSYQLDGKRTTIPDLTTWQIDASDPIEISGYTDVSISIDLSTSDNLGIGDYIQVQYNIDGIGWTDFAVNGYIGVNFISEVASQIGLSGSSLLLRIIMFNNNNGEHYYADNIIVTGTPVIVNTIWTGITSTDWNNASNWSDNTVPSKFVDVIIPTAPGGLNFPETNTGSGAICHDLVIESGAHLYIPFDNTITVNFVLTNNAGLDGLVIQSTINGTGSLIHNTNGVNATVKQMLTEDEWHYVSSPIANATSNVFLGIYLKSFIESTYSWGDYITATNLDLEVMKGYAAWTYDPVAVSFKGLLNNGNQSIGVTAQNTGVNVGYNLVGNPYPSALDWDAVGWDKTSVDNTIYFWKGLGGIGGTGNYYYYVGTGGDIPGASLGYEEANSSTIPAMQSFFVRATGNGTFGVDNNARVHSDQAYYKNREENTLPLIRLRAENSTSLYDETIIRFYSGATAEHDGDYDAFKLEGYLVPQLYSITPEQSNLAINTHSTFENGTIIPLGFVSHEEGEYSIKVSEFENFEMGTEIYLEDLLNDVMYNLSIDPEYVFTSTPDDISERFNLHFVKSASNIESTSAESIQIYSYDNNVYINSPGSLIKEVVMVDIMGREVFRNKGYETNLLSIAVKEKAGYIIVQVRTDNNVSTKKVFIK